MGVDDGQFAKLTANGQPTAPASSGGAEPGSAGGEPAVSTDVPATVPAVASAETPAVPAQPAAATVTVDSYIAAAPEPIREWLGEGLASLQGERSALIEKLTANERCPYTADQLKQKANRGSACAPAARRPGAGRLQLRRPGSDFRQRSRCSCCLQEAAGRAGLAERTEVTASHRR